MVAMTAREAHVLEREVQTWLHTCPSVADAAVVLTGFPRDARVTSCRRCGIASVFPGISFDAERVCSLCRDYEVNFEQMMRYFREPADFVRVVRERAAAGDGEYDCLLLYSGGKDSSYVLFRLLDLGLRVMTFTFDNGFISRTALRNVDAITSELGVEHVTLTRADQPAVFLESLKEFKSVCNGCFRSLLELGHQVATERRIPSIVTGLSRGQIIDERLSWFYRNHIYDPERIERDLAQGGEVYRLFHGGFSGESVEVVDFYRYSDVTKEEIRARLAEHPSWQQPADTGFCSSNCLINDVGVYVHQRERGYHNYESPTRWEVRIGHLDRAEADQELAEPASQERVRTMLAKIGYSEPSEQQVLAERMIAYVQPAEGGLDAVRTWATSHDGVSVKPARWVGLAEIPWDDGELDVTRLPRMSDSRFDASPAPPPADEIAGYLQPAVAARMHQPSGPRVRAVALSIEPAMSVAELRPAILAAFREVPAARLRWSDTATPVLERRTWRGAPFRRLDLSETSVQQWEQQVTALAGRLRKRHDPREGCLQVYVLDGPDGAQALILTADESGLGPRGLAPFVAELGAVSGRWDATGPDLDTEFDRAVGPPDELPATAVRSVWNGTDPDALLASVLDVATQHGVDGTALAHGYHSEGTDLGQAVLVHARRGGTMGRATLTDVTNLPVVEVVFYDNAGRGDGSAPVLPLEPELTRFDTRPECVLSVDVIPFSSRYEVICRGQARVLAAVPAEWGREVTT